MSMNISEAPKKLNHNAIKTGTGVIANCPCQSGALSPKPQRPADIRKTAVVHTERDVFRDAVALSLLPRYGLPFIIFIILL